MSAIVAFLSIIVMIIFHEWGHYIAGRICKIPIYEFAVGMGPVIKQKKAKNGTIFSLRLVPIGGFCSFDDAKDSAIQDSALNELPVFKRIFICAMGPIVNLFTGFLIFVLLATFIGVQVESNRVHSTLEGYPAQNILQEGDLILEVNDEEISPEFTLSTAVNKYAPETLKITIQRDKEIFDVEITPQFSGEKYMIGIYNEYIFVKGDFSTIITKSINKTIYSITSVYNGLFSLFANVNNLQEMSGIIGIVSFMSEYATLATIHSFLTIVALISINLGIMNLLPIPGLDGSKILFSLIEVITGKKIPPKTEAKLINIGFVALLAILLIVAFNDIYKLLF